MVRFKKFLLIPVLFLLSEATLSVAQTATVKHNVNLRSAPSTDNPPIVLLKPHTELGVLDLDATNGYYRVITADEQEGWVWARNVSIDGNAEFDLTPEIPPYNRTDWKHWIDADHDCHNTRNEVLIRDSEIPVKFKPRQDGKPCAVTAGRWTDPYSGVAYTDPQKLDIDHLVPLENAYLSGGWKWDNQRRQDYANTLDDPRHLLPVAASLNRAKGAKGPDEWTPPNQEFWCVYGREWERIKSEWHLSMTTTEASAVRDLEKYCQ